MEIDAVEIMLIVAGLVAFLIVYLYRKDKESTTYKASVYLGLVAGIGLAASLALSDDKIAIFDFALITIAAFALIIRPFREVEFSIILAFCVMLIVYFYLGGLGGDLEGLSHGWPRIIIALFAGALVYMVLNFLEKITKMFGKFLNLWPVLFLLAVICIIEGVLLLAGKPSLYDYILDWQNSKVIISAFTDNL